MSAQGGDPQEQFMRQALALAQRAEAQGEVPVGAVVVLDGEVIGEGWNRNIELDDPAAHAEIMALRQAGSRVGNHRLVGAELYVTLEPCMMCVGACIHARLTRVIFGASDPKTGALGGQADLQAAAHHNHAFEVQGGVLARESSEQLKRFFRERRTRAEKRHASSVDPEQQLEGD
jgi:tRNA(adenine34) deaminase